MNIEQGRDRNRKKSLMETHSPGYVPPEVKYKRRRSFQGKHSRDRDFFAPDQVEEWVLPEYRSLFHHLFLKEDEDSHSVTSESRDGNTDQVITDANTNTPLALRLRKVSRSDSGNSAVPEEDGPLMSSFTKHFPSWLKKVFHMSDNNEEQQQHQNEIDRHAWLDEIPIEICDKLRHIHIYV